MKLPWDKNYVKISFHVIVTLVCIYILSKIVDMLAYGLSNIGKIYSGLADAIGSVSGVFACVIIGFIIAYLLDPAADFFQTLYENFYDKYLKNIKPIIKIKKRKQRKETRFKTRTAGAALLYISILLVITLIFVLFYSKVSEFGGENFAENAALFVSHTINEFYNTYRTFEDYLIKWGIYKYAADAATQVIYEFTDFLKNFGAGFAGFVKSIGGGAANFLIGAVIGFYFIKDKELIKQRSIDITDILFPKRVNTVTRNVLSDINDIFSGYIRGQLTDAAIMACLISLGLSLIGVDFALLIGIVSGFSNIIPYFGAIIGFLLAVSVALMSGAWTKAIYAAILMIVLQQIDSVFIVPKVVGESVELSPVLVLIALSVAGALFGIPGMILAVPVFATIKLFMTKYLKRREMLKGRTEK